ncbi:MAG TPA: YggS family pyridoxal phosphate-dependent enzyme [Micromonosporaceae bacterium]|nr:YggS family pyridoxal phosphate-dependent enzyme [Micromonosporaceae bacterium]
MGHPGDGSDPRTDELARNLAAVRQRINAACVAAGRAGSEVTLIAVTKTYPAEDVMRLVRLGVAAVGENRDQEAAGKAAAVAGGAAGMDDVVWHFIGQLQRNKCRSVVRYAGAVHSVDSVPLARALGEAADRHREHPLDVCVQVSLDADLSRGGAVDAGAVDAGAVDADAVDADALEIGGSVPPDRRLDRVLATVAESGALRLRGLMAVAPLRGVPDEAFAALAAIAARTRAMYPDATWLSAGMSADLEAAVRHGSTHVRIGSALLGKRPSLG